MCVKMMHDKAHLRMYSNIKWQISTMQKPQLCLYQPNNRALIHTIHVLIFIIPDAHLSDWGT